MSGQRVRFAMVGGGEGAFIGEVHRLAARLAGLELVSGAFSSDPTRGARSGASLGLAPERVHSSWQSLIADETARDPADAAQFVAIVTPNHLHAPVAVTALDAGLPVLSDKPLADRLEAAQAIADAAARGGGLVGITHTYSGYPMVKQMRALVADGVLGPIRRVSVAYTQDWLSREADTAGSAQAAWRTDPARAGEAGAFGDIGTHAFDLVRTVTGEEVTHLLADIRAAVPDRALDDDGAALLRLSGGGRGTLVASQVCTGDINRLDLAVYGEHAGLHWRQEDPSRLTLTRRDRPSETWTAGVNMPYLTPEVRAAARVPAGHPEGYIEAFANIYLAFADAVVNGAIPDLPGFATLPSALATMRFLRGVRRSHEGGNVWIALDDVG